MLSRITKTQNLYKSQRNNNNSNNHNLKKSKPNFKGPIDLGFQVGSQFLNFLNASPAIGACFVDFGFMVTPRTVVDFKRSANAGMETGFRESMGTTNHAMAGAVGLGAGYLVSHAFNKANGVKAHLMFMDGHSIDTFKDFVNSSIKENEYDSRTYWETFFKSIKGYNTTKEGSTEVWHSLSNDTQKKAVNLMLEAESDKYKVPKQTLNELVELITGETEAASTFKIVKGNTDTGVTATLKDLIGNANSMLRMVKDKALHDGTGTVKDLNEFLKGVKNKKVATVVAGLSIPATIGMSAQPFNRYLTKKRTGSDGFVGVEGRQPDKTLGFKILKAVTGLAISSAMIACILKNPKNLYTKPVESAKEILKNLQYKGIVPTLDQFKFIYGVTIMSRILAARDKDEMRESIIKDTLGFANWLILGGFVSKLAARAFNKKIINYDEAKYGKGLMSFIKNSVEKTHEEILYPILKKLNIPTTENGKTLPFRKLLAAVSDVAKTNGENAQIAQKALKQIKQKNYAQLLGYIYSGVVLGWGIPKLNIAITNNIEKRRKAKLTEQNANKDKMKVSKEFIQNKIQNETKTFNAFYGAM